MEIAPWAVAIILAVAFFGAGLLKATKPKDELRTRMAWVDDFSPSTIKLIGVVEVLGAIGLVLPAAVDVLPILVPIAAAGLAITMVLAAIVHLRRKEVPMVVPNIVLAALALFVAWGRFGDYNF